MENNEKKVLAPKDSVFDRIEQSFYLFKNNFKQLFMPLFVYTYFTVVVFKIILTYVLIRFFKSILFSSPNIKGLDFLHYDSQIIIGIIIGTILIIGYLTLYIPFLLATIKGIKQAYLGEKINCKENVRYGFKRFLASFKTYWYSFEYVALIPALVGIFAGILFIFGEYSTNENISKLGAGLGIFALVLFLFFAIYRGIKASFALSSAVDKDEYTKENFYLSVGLTKDKFWRIIGNFILLSFLISIVSGIIGQITYIFGSSFDLSSLAPIGEKPDMQEIFSSLSDLIETYSPIQSFLSSSISGFLDITFKVFGLVFTYIFFKRLELEKNPELDNRDVEL